MLRTFIALALSYTVVAASAGVADPGLTPNTDPAITPSHDIRLPIEFSFRPGDILRALGPIVAMSDDAGRPGRVFAEIGFGRRPLAFQPAVRDSIAFTPPTTAESGYVVGGPQGSKLAYRGDEAPTPRVPAVPAPAAVVLGAIGLGAALRLRRSQHSA